MLLARGNLSPAMPPCSNPTLSRSLVGRRAFEPDLEAEQPAVVDMAERVGFEPTVELPRQQFSRLPDSAALAPLRYGRSSAGLSIEQVRRTCPMGVPSLPWSMPFCNGFAERRVIRLTRKRDRYGGDVTLGGSSPIQIGKVNSDGSTLSNPCLTSCVMSRLRSIFRRSSIRVFVLGWGGVNSLQQSWSGSMEVS